MALDTTADTTAGERSQQKVIEFLQATQAYPFDVDHVERIDTHGAIVFLAGTHVYKIKRAVQYEYMDFSTLALREAVCRHELLINKKAAPQIYKDVVPIVVREDGP